MADQVPGARYGTVPLVPPEVRTRPDEVHTEALRILNRARVLREVDAAAAGLDGRVTWESCSGEAFGLSLAEVRPVLREVASRFELGGEILRAYSDEARRVQARLHQLGGELVEVEDELDALQTAPQTGPELDPGTAQRILARYTALSPRVNELIQARQQVYEDFLAYDRSAAARLDEVSASHLANPRDYDLAEQGERVHARVSGVLDWAATNGGPPGQAAADAVKRPETWLVGAAVAGALVKRARHKEGSYQEIVRGNGSTLIERVVPKRLTGFATRQRVPAGMKPELPVAAKSAERAPGTARRLAAAARRHMVEQVTQTAEVKATREVVAALPLIRGREIYQTPRRGAAARVAASGAAAVNAVKGAKSAYSHAQTAGARVEQVWIRVQGGLSHDAAGPGGARAVAGGAPRDAVGGVVAESGGRSADGDGDTGARS